MARLPSRKGQLCGGNGVVVGHGHRRAVRGLVVQGHGLFRGDIQVEREHQLQVRLQGRGLGAGPGHRQGGRWVKVSQQLAGLDGSGMQYIANAIQQGDGQGAVFLVGQVICYGQAQGR